MSLRSRLSRTLIRMRSGLPALGFTLGLCSGQVIAWFLNPMLISLVGVATGLGALVARMRGGGAFLGLLVGMVTAAWAGAVHPPSLSGADVQMLLRVEDTPRRRVPGEVVFLGREILGAEQRLIRCRAVDLPWRSLSMVEQGDVVWVRGAVVPIVRPFNPFSWEAWLWRRGVSGELKVLFGSKALVRTPPWLSRVREWIIQSVTSASREGRGGSLLLSMAFGVRDLLSAPVESLFARFGLSHLLVVSGYQVSLVFGVVFSTLVGVGRSLHLSLGMRNGAVAVSLLCATVYVLTIGTEMSSVRALFAAVCGCLSLVMNRKHGFAQRLVMTFLCMHLVWPWALFEEGVVLTFAALAGIGIGSVVGAEGRLRSLLWVTVCVWVLTSLVTVIWNGTVSMSGLVLNLLLAAPWSVLNCTVGVGGLLLLAMNMPGAEVLVRFVGYGNEAIVSALFWLHDMVGPPRELMGPERIALAITLFGVGGLLIRAAFRMERAVSLRTLVRGGYHQRSS